MASIYWEVGEILYSFKSGVLGGSDQDNSSCYRTEKALTELKGTCQEGRGLLSEENMEEVGKRRNL